MKVQRSRQKRQRRWIIQRRRRRRHRTAARGAGDSEDVLDRQVAADLPGVQPGGRDAVPVGQRRARRAARVRHENAHELDKVTLLTSRARNCHWDLKFLRASFANNGSHRKVSH